jgi:hypothetical protein
MLAELTTMTVQSARAVLQDVSRLSPEQVEEAEKVIRGFYGQKPRSFCVACSCYIFSEHRTADGNSVWACSNCHRSPMSHEEWNRRQAPAFAKAGSQGTASRRFAEKNSSRQSRQRLRRGQLTLMRLVRWHG